MLKKLFNRLVFSKYIALINEITPNTELLYEYTCGGFIYEDWENVGKDLTKAIEEYSG